MNLLTHKIIYSITPFTLLDYPDKTACIFWFVGCNMKCGYCYNPEIVFGKGRISISEAVSFLQKRKELLDAVVFSGGECLLHKEVFTLMQWTKKMGFLVKIDTNGIKPHLLEIALNSGWVDYIALDFKATQNKMYSITKSNQYSLFKETVALLVKHKISFEIRTTVHSDLLSSADIEEMISVLESLDYSGNYYIQHFRNGSETIQKINDSVEQSFIHLSTQKIKVIHRN